MSSGIMRNWHMTKVLKAKTPMAYFLSMQEYMLYEMNVITFNTKERIKALFDKYKQQLS
jgi:hypothetical protein